MNTPSVTKRAQRVRSSGWVRKGLTLLILGLFGVLSLVLSSTPQRAAAASADSNLNFQARLLTNTGAVVPDGNYNIDFKIYNADSTTGSVGTCTGACLWEETRQNSASNGVKVVNGYFSVNLGSVTGFGAINWDQQLWLTMNIGGVSTGGSPTYDGEMQNSGHSIQLTAVPLAFRANQLAIAGTNEQVLQFASGTFGQTTTISLPDPGATTATVCYQSASACGFAASSGSTYYIQNTTSAQTANFNVQSAGTSSVAAVIQGASGQTADLLDVENGSTVFSVGNNGQTLFKPTSGNDSTTFFQIQPASSSTPVLDVNTTSKRIGINTASPTRALDVHAAPGDAVVANLQGSGGTLVDIQDASTGNSIVRLYNASGGYNWQFGMDAADNSFRVERAKGTSFTTSSALVIAQFGATTFKNTTDSTTAFQIQPAGSTTPVLNVDTSNSYVGIGTSAPGSSLDVRGAGNFQNTSTQELVVQSGSFTKTLTVDTSNNEIGIGAAPSGSGAMLQVAGAENINTASTTAFQIQNSSTNVFQVDSSNVRVGIGTASAPIATLQVEKSSYTSNEVVINNGTTGTPPAYPNSWAPTFVVNSSETTASRPLFFGYSSGGAWASMLTAGACGSYSQMCLDMGTTNAATVLENVGTQLNIGGGNDGNFSTVVFGNDSTTNIQNGLILGKSSSTNGSVVFGAAGGSNTVTLQLAANPTSSYVMQLPTAIASNNQCLAAGTVSGSNVPLTFANCSNGVTNVGAFSNTSIANGASISGTTITFGAADATNPGMVSTSAQTIAGDKTLTGNSLFTGTATVQTTSSAAFHVQNASSAAVFNIDSTNARIGINNSFTAMATPTGLTVGTATSGGSLTASSTYRYKVTAIDGAGGESAASTEASGTTGSSTKKLPVSWTAVTGSHGYNLYRTAAGGATGTEVFLTSVLTNSYTDDGSQAAGTATPPTANTAYTFTNTASSTLQLSIGGNGTPTGQLYVSGQVPAGPVGTVSLGSGVVPYSMVVQGDYAYTANHGDGNLDILDISNPATPKMVGQYDIYGGPNGVAVAGRYAYVVNNSHEFTVIDISNPASPTEAAQVSTGSGTIPMGIYIQGRYAYVTNSGNNTLGIWDIANPLNPVNVKNLSLQGTVPYSVYVVGRYAYIADFGTSSGTSKIEIVDVNDPPNAATVSGSFVGTGLNPDSIYVQGRYAYVSTGGADKLQIFDVSNVSAPVSVSTVATDSGSPDPISVYVQGRYAYVANFSTGNVGVIDISDPAQPALIGTMPTGSHPVTVYVQGRYAYSESSTNNTLVVFDLGGTYTQQLEAGGTETGTLAVRGDSTLFGNASIQGGVNIGQSLNVSGNIGTNGQLLVQSGTNSTTAFQIQNASGSNLFAADTTNSQVNVTGKTVLTVPTSTVFPTTPVLDNFNRASLGSGWTSPILDTHGSASIIGSTQLGFTTASYSSDADWNASAFGPNTEVYADLPTLPTTAIDLAYRETSLISSASLYFMEFVPSTSTWTLNLFNGSETTICTYSSSTSVSAGDSIGASVLGNVHSAWLKHSGVWSQVGSSCTDSTLMGAGYIGVQINDTTTRLDNFGGGTINGGNALTVNGSFLSQTSVNSTNAFQVQNASSTPLLTADTNNSLVIIGSGSAGETAGQLLVLDSDSDATLVSGTASNAPTEVDGAMFYSATDKSFICGENGTWRSCIGGLVNASTAVSSAITGTTTKTDFSGGTNNSYTILAGDCQPGVTYLITAQGTWLETTTTSPATLTLYLDKDSTSTALLTTPSAQSVSTASVSVGWQITAQMICDTTTSVEIQGSAIIGRNNTSTSVTEPLVNTSTLSWDTSAHTLLIGAKFSSSTGSPTITMRQFIVQRIGP